MYMGVTSAKANDFILIRKLACKIGTEKYRNLMLDNFLNTWLIAAPYFSINNLFEIHKKRIICTCGYHICSKIDVTRYIPNLFHDLFQEIAFTHARAEVSNTGIKYHKALWPYYKRISCLLAWLSTSPNCKSAETLTLRNCRILYFRYFVAE